MALKNQPSVAGGVKKAVAPPVIQDKINSRVRVQSLIDAHFKYTGPVSGEQYEWPKAGSIVSVAEGDVSDLLSKRLGGKSCCGSEDTNRIFQLAS